MISAIASLRLFLQPLKVLLLRHAPLLLRASGTPIEELVRCSGRSGLKTQIRVPTSKN